MSPLFVFSDIPKFISFAIENPSGERTVTQFPVISSALINGYDFSINNALNIAFTDLLLCFDEYTQ